jgi:hypothetical protein
MTDLSYLNGKKVLDYWESQDDARLALALETEDKEEIFILVDLSTTPVADFDCVDTYAVPTIDTNDLELICGVRLNNCKMWSHGITVQRYYAGFSVFLENDGKWIAQFNQEILLLNKHLRDNEAEYERFMANTWFPTVKQISAIEYATLISEQ